MDGAIPLLPLRLYGADSSLSDDVNRSDLIVLNCLGYIQAGDRSEPREKCVKTSVYATRTPSLHAQTAVYTALYHTVYTSLDRISINEEPPRELKICCYKCVIARTERDGIRAETRFRLSPKRTSPFKSVGASVQSTAGSRSVRISLSNAG